MAGERAGGDPGAGRRREQVAREAARLLARGAADPTAARREAAHRLGVHEPGLLPGTAEILAALADYRRLFGGGLDPDELRHRRRAALEAMEAFADFDPRLTGPVLDGSADSASPVRLHLHADDPDAIALRLAERGAPARQVRARIIAGDGRSTEVSCWRLEAGGLPFELWVLPAQAARQGPRDPLDGGPLARAGLAAVRRLVDDTAG